MAKKIPGYKYGNPYKFKGLKIFSSSEWLADSKRKYRRVFDKSEINYLRWEFSLYNKLFDEEDWSAKVSIKTYKKGSTKKLVCDLKENVNVNKTDNIIFVNKSWGVDKYGSFWKKGEYITEAYLDNELISTETFHILEIGKPTQTYNPFFDVVSLRLYEGKKFNSENKTRDYMVAFNQKEARYIWTELKIKNKLNIKWQLEYFINIYNEAGQPKASIINMKTVAQNTKGKTLTYSRGWGNEEGGSWKDDKYVIDIVFMDTLVASVSFETGEQNIAGTSKLNTDGKKTAIQVEVNEKEKPSLTLKDVVANLDKLIGLEKIKTKIKEHISYLDFIKLREAKGFEDDEQITLHSVFTGNPGTGKTTVVKLLGQIYQKMGLLSKGHVHEVGRADLVGEYIGQTAPRTKEAIKEAKGGILFIDEAYSLRRSEDDPKDFGKEVIEVILKEMSDGDGDIAIMMAGYPKEMDIFINSNPGMKSRVKYFFNFDDYTPEELMYIAKYASVKRSVKLEKEAEIIVKKLIVEAYRNRNRTFGNARYSYSLIDEGKMNMGLRIMSGDEKNLNNLSKDELSTITVADIKKIIDTKQKIKIDIAIDEELLKSSLKELNSLVGLRKIKSDISELVKLVRYYRETGKDVLNQFSLHTVFTGNPGTGKTTMARIMGKIYKALGLLERGHVIETGKDGLIAGYIGQTALKTKEKIEESMGGVLFIDEAYALTSGGKGNYGGEAVEILLKSMEDKRGLFAVIVAGYPENMDQFLRTNPGLMSRFDRTLHFNDYKVETLLKIAEFMFKEQNLVLDKKSKEHLQNYLKIIYKSRDKYFGNAREVRKIMEQTIKKQNLRMASLNKEERTDKMMKTITVNDVKHFVYKKQIGGAIGFGK